MQTYAFAVCFREVDGASELIVLEWFHNVLVVVAIEILAHPHWQGLLDFKHR